MPHKNPLRLLQAPAWFLLLATPFIIESCITAATPPSHWLNPGIALLLILAYGPPIIMLRELWVRHALPLRSLFVFGFSYGLLNEGILAHTLTQVNGEPITHFIGYDEAIGIHWAWASLIVPWHAFFSVTFMVLLTHLWFPGQAQTPWLGKRGWRIMAGLTLLLVPLYFVFASQTRPAPLHAFPLYLILMALCLWCGFHAKPPKKPPLLPSRHKLLVSAMLALPVPAAVTIAGFEFAHHKLSMALYCGFTLSVSAFIFYRLGRIHSYQVLAFMLGGTVGLCGIAALLSRDPLYFASGPVFIGLIVISLRKLLDTTAKLKHVTPES